MIQIKTIIYNQVNDLVIGTNINGYVYINQRKFDYVLRKS